MEPFKFLDPVFWSMSSNDIAQSTKLKVVEINPDEMVHQIPYRTPDKKHKTLSKLIKLKDSVNTAVDPDIVTLHRCLEFCISQINNVGCSLTPYGIEALNKIKAYIDHWNIHSKLVKNNFGNNIRNTIDVIMGESDGDQ